MHVGAVLLHHCPTGKRRKQQRRRGVLECYFGHRTFASVAVTGQTAPIDQRTFVQGTNHYQSVIV